MAKLRPNRIKQNSTTIMIPTQVLKSTLTIKEYSVRAKTNPEVSTMHSTTKGAPYLEA